MIPIIIKADLISQPPPTSSTRSVTPVTPITAIPHLQDALSDFVPGQKYQAIVETRLANGNSRVLIAGQLLQMRFPEEIPYGNQFELVFISKEPRPQFLLPWDAPSITEKNNASISSTGRLLVTLTQATDQLTASDSPKHTAPILSSPPLNSLDLPVLLKQALSQSGLFYEFHQAQWIAGKKTLEQLRQEPQGHLMPTATALPDSGISADAQSLSLVQQQLNALETGHLIWHGEIWPGQSMEWEISEHSTDSEHETIEPSQWQTQLRITLPLLGKVTATIMLNPDSTIRIKLDTAQTGTAVLLKNNQFPLATSMSTAGLNVQAIEVQHESSE